MYTELHTSLLLFSGTVSGAWIENVNCSSVASIGSCHSVLRIESTSSRAPRYRWSTIQTLDKDAKKRIEYIR